MILKMNGIDPTPYCFLCLARGEVESMIKFQHEIGANSTIEEDQSPTPQHQEGIEKPQQ